MGEQARDFVETTLLLLLKIARVQSSDRGDEYMDFSICFEKKNPSA
jgi:hypothetical protein